MSGRRCFNCMDELRGSVKICPKCGFDNSRPNQPAHALPCGTALQNRYIIGRMLGQGGFGITYIGFDYKMEIPVCVKEYFPTGGVMRRPGSTAVYWSPGTSGNEMKQGREILVKEARKAVKLRELDSVVKVWDVFYENETAYIVMEYINGMTLKEYLMKRDRVMDLKECLEVLGPVIRDLQEVHKIGIIHRDISPDNIMIREDGKVKLLDLGAAKDMTKGKETLPEEEQTRLTDHPRAGEGTITKLDDPSSLVAKRGFSPPEQCTGKGEIGPWTDVYAMCATIYWCLTGNILPDVMERVMEGDKELSFPESVPSKTASVLKHGLEMNPNRRIKDCEELLKELDPGSVTPPPPYLKYVLAALAIAIIAAIIVFVIPHPPQPGEELAKLTRKAEKGDAQAQNDLGFAYYKGEETEQDFETAVIWFTKSAKEGFAEGLNNLGDCYWYGIGVEQDYAKARECYKEAAEQNNAEGQVNLGYCYQKGLGGDQDNETAANLYLESSRQDNPEARVKLGYCYQKGLGVEQDKERAVKLYNKSAEQGYLIADLFLANCYYDDRWEGHDDGKAYELYKKICDEIDFSSGQDFGDCYYYGVGENWDLEDCYASAKAHLGMCYEKGCGVDQDYTSAIKWYKKAAENNNAIGLCYLGNSYREGVVFVNKENEAVDLYQQAADQGSDMGQYYLGECYCNGQGVDQNYKKANAWLEQAAKQGNADAQRQLGKHYYNGSGFDEPNYKKAVEWFEKAAVQGHAEGQYWLGYCYYKGKGYNEPDLKKAVEWFEKAAAQGFAKGQFYLGLCYYRGDGFDKKDPREAAIYFRKAADQGHANAQNWLGYCYEHGHGVEQSDEIAEKWYKKSADQGNENAQENLESLKAKKKGS